MLRDNEEPRFCRFCRLWVNSGQWNEHRMKEAGAMLKEFLEWGTTSFVVQALMCFSGREREFKFPASDAPLWILEYGIKAWVREIVGEEEHYFTGVHLMLEGRTFVDVYDYHRRNPEEIPLSSMFGDVATDGKYDVAVVLDSEKSVTAKDAPILEMAG